jgi:hypothetical protein
MADKPVKELSRRDALKLLGAAAGATVLANLPSKWSTPALTAGVLPAHAQTSVALAECPDLGLTVSVQFDLPIVDVDLMLMTPAGFLVTPKPSGPNQGMTDPLTLATHSGDAPVFPATAGTETITVPLGAMTNGLWEIRLLALLVSAGTGPVTVTFSGACNVTVTPTLTKLVMVTYPIQIANCLAVACPASID